MTFQNQSNILLNSLKYVNGDDVSFYNFCTKWAVFSDPITYYDILQAYINFITMPYSVRFSKAWCTYITTIIIMVQIIEVLYNDNNYIVLSKRFTYHLYTYNWLMTDLGIYLWSWFSP